MHESGEMYLETILLLSKKQEKVRAIDIVKYMDFSKPSVSRGLSILKNGGHIEVAPNGAITLTDSGREIAEKIYARHVLVQDQVTGDGGKTGFQTHDQGSYGRIQPLLADDLKGIADPG